MRNQGFCGTQRESQTMHGLRFIYYFNPSSAVACFIRNSRGELLLVRRAKEPAKGRLDLPGGFVDMHESAEEAAQREVKEEQASTSPVAAIFFPSPIFILIAALRCIQSICFSNASPNPSTEQRLKTMQPRSLFCQPTN